MAAGDPGVLQRNYSAIAVETTLTASISASSQGASGTIIVGSVAGFPSSVPYTLAIDPDTAREEIVTVTATSGTTLTVLRGGDNTQAVAHSAGVSVRHAVSARDFKEEKTHAAARGYDTDQAILDAVGQTHVHGIVTGEGDVVGTLKTQSLSNKTLVSPTITGTPGVATSIVFEGATADDYETTLTVTDPTADRTITLPNATGNVVLDTLAQTLTNKTLTSPTISGSPVITGLSSAGMSASSATPKDYVDSILGSATAASTSAASAATSASSAATSASSAAASATSAAASSTTAANSASAAATSATSAAASATAAATSATSAAASATAAATSATSAAASATAAASSATTAAASVATIASYASAAATSASSAATSASNALTSANSAATSASTMAASVTAAATSAASAATSATAAATSASSAATSASAALTSANSAATSATAAATSATSAAASATTAANSVATIATYASNAATSATSAATSATSAAASATAAASSATDAATTYDNFDDRYLGPKNVAPTVDNDGNALLTGAMYWNIGASSMYVWSGSTWVQINLATAYTAPTLGSTTIASNTTYSNVDGLTINSTTIPTSATLTKTSDKLSVFAATTSAELAGVISDETGTGSLVFANTPTLVTPALGVATATSINGTTIPTSATLLTSGGALGTPSSGTLTNATELPVTGITASTTAALGVGSIELGHATDTTLSRSAAGVLAVEGVVIPSISSSNTLTNKSISGSTNTLTNIPNSALTNSSITINGSSVSLGGSATISSDSTPTVLMLGGM